MIANAALGELARRTTVAAVALAACFLTGIGPARAQTCDPAIVRGHAIHTQDGFARLALACAECHAPVCNPNPASSVAFGGLASRDGAQPRWDPATGTCSGVYCHGATTTPPSAPVAWTYVDPSIVRPLSQQCVICHGYPPGPPHESVGGSECHTCHPSVAADGTIDVAGGRHLDGILDVSGGACNSCHGQPPATGAHVAHYGLEGGSGFGDLSTLQDRSPLETPTSAPQVYAFGCGNCHPAGSHRNGAVEVAVSASDAPPDSLMSKAAETASYDATTKTCSGVYCHSSGQETPVYVTTPGWFSGASVGCAGCHANPPRYPSGGAGSPTANSHLDLGDDGYEFGHFLGMPGPWHTSKHGENGWGAGEDAAPITCQSCHFDTTDPANTGPSGFYYLDTTGDYALPGGDPGRISWGWQASIQCGYCHDGGLATGSGKVLPLRHVNGVRDVVFDARTTLPAISWLPAAPNAPTGPYWMTGTQQSLPYPAWVEWSSSRTTVSFGLGTAAYEPETKTCSNVACHLAQEQPVWGTPYQYYTNQSATCYTCHPM